MSNKSEISNEIVCEIDCNSLEMGIIIRAARCRVESAAARSRNVGFVSARTRGSEGNRRGLATGAGRKSEKGEERRDGGVGT